MRQRRKRRFFTAAESADIWDRWRKGEGLKSIGRVFGKNSSSIFAIERFRHLHFLLSAMSSTRSLSSQAATPALPRISPCFPG